MFSSMAQWLWITEPTRGNDLGVSCVALDDAKKIHPCSGDISYHGFEIAMGMCLSSHKKGKIELPIEEIPDEPILETLKRELPDT